MTTADMFIAVVFNLLKQQMGSTSDLQAESIPVPEASDFKQKVEEFENELSNLVSSFSPSDLMDNTNT